MNCKNYMANMKEILRNYYLVTGGAFFADEQKKILLNLFARVNDVEPNTRVYLLLSRTVERVESLQLETGLECANWIFLNRFCGTAKEELLAVAIHSLRDALEQGHLCPTVGEWYQEMQNGGEQTLFSAAMLDYCNGDCDGAIQKLKFLKKQNHMRAVECLAQITLELGRSEDAYEALLVAKMIHRKLRQEEKCWIEFAVQHLEGSILNKQQIKTLRASAMYNGQKQPIGFVSQF